MGIGGSLGMLLPKGSAGAKGGGFAVGGVKPELELKMQQRRFMVLTDVQKEDGVFGGREALGIEGLMILLEKRSTVAVIEVLQDIFGGLLVAKAVKAFRGRGRARKEELCGGGGKQKGDTAFDKRKAKRRNGFSVHRRVLNRRV